VPVAQRSHRLEAGATIPVSASDSEAVAGYPAREIVLTVGDLHPRLLTVERLDDYVDAEALLRDADPPEPPYWAHVWPASLSLARLLAAAACRGRRVIDIGCGLGLVGIVAAMRGAEVTVTDSVHEALCFARASAQLNRCRVTTVRTDLRQPGLRGRFDYCVAADVTYDPALQAAVAEFLATHLAPGGRAWCAESVRTFDAALQRACAQHGLHTQERNMTELDDGRSVSVRLTEVAWESRPGA